MLPAPAETECFAVMVRLQLRGKGPKKGPHGQYPEIIGPMKKQKTKKRYTCRYVAQNHSETWVRRMNRANRGNVMANVVMHVEPQ